MGIWAAQVVPNSIEDAFLYLSAAAFVVLGVRYLWTVCCPGTLTIDPEGLTQDLGWRRRHWAWNEIDHAERVRTPGNLASAYVIYPHAGGRFRLFGWRVSTDELQRKIETYLQS
ncbi:MAG: hypothetical protein ABIR08_03320 [Sphingomonas sp.]